MKVIGSGAPEVMTVWPERSELSLWRRELCRILARLADGEEGWDTTRPFGGYHESPNEELRVQRVEARRLMREIRAAETSATDAVRVAGPSHLIFHVVHQVAAAAVERLVEARDACRRSHELSRLREATALLGACLDTLEACQWVDRHGWNYYVHGLEDPDSMRDADLRDHSLPRRAMTSRGHSRPSGGEVRASGA